MYPTVAFSVGTIIYGDVVVVGVCVCADVYGVSTCCAGRNKDKGMHHSSLARSMHSLRYNGGVECANRRAE